MIDHYPELASDPRPRHRLLASIALASLARRELSSPAQERSWWARCSLLAAGALRNLQEELDFEAKEAALSALLDFDILSQRGAFPLENPKLAQYLNSIPGFEPLDSVGQGASQRDHHGYFQAALLPILSESIDALLQLEPYIAEVGHSIARESAEEVIKACKAYEIRRQIGSCSRLADDSKDGARSL